jgi:predicted ATPase/DNA-binding XRE family transcriptional regulator
MTSGPSRAPARSFAAQLKALREAAGFTQDELATVAGLSVHSISALERGERRRPHVETVRALSAALDLAGPARDALLASARTPVRTTAADEPGGSLPLPLTALLGREHEMKVLRHWLAEPAARIMTLVGPGGVGKTRLALEFARGVAEEGSTRVVFAPLAAIRDPAFVASAIAEALGLADVNALDLPKRARLACDDSPTLLVVDNFEHLLAMAPLLAELVTSVKALRLLVTSRAPLRVRGEREFVVGPLAVDARDEAHDEAMSTADLARAPAVRLFLERARDVQPDFRLTAANASTVSAICRRLDALPLALELAAPWIKVLSPQDLLRRLEHDVLLSAVGPRDLPERQRTMNATVGWSYQLLDEDEQRAFRRFGALPGLFPIDAAAAVLAGRQSASDTSDAALRATASLIDKSLLLRAETSAVPTCPLYYMLETVRAYAAVELFAAGERDEAMEGVVRYCRTEAALAAKGLVGPAQSEWLDRVREDLESYRGALTWLIAHGRATDAADIAYALLFFWLIRGHGIEAVQWYEQILRLPALPPVAESRALSGAAVIWYSQGELQKARTALARALLLAEAAGDMAILAEAEHFLGFVEYAAGNAHAARDRLVRGLRGFEALAIPWGIASALIGTAWVALAAGDAAEAERLLEQAALPLRQSGPWFLSLVSYLRAILALRRGNADEAIALTRENLTRLRDFQDKFAFVYALVPLASAAIMKGDDAWAARILGASEAVTERTGVTVVDTSVNDLKEQAEREARARLGSERWTQSYAAGRRSSIDALLKDIDTVTNR